MTGTVAGSVHADPTAAQETQEKEASTLPSWVRFGVSPIAIALMAVLALRQPVEDPDVFWHIRTGQWLPGTWQFSGPEPWSPASSNTWILHEWLPELFLGGVEAAAGLGGVAFLFVVSVALLGAAVWIICRRRASALLAGLIVLVTFIAMMGSISPRPQLVTFVLAAVFSDAWLRTAEDGRARWWLIPLTWLWACSHGMWFLGPLIGATVLAGGWFDRAVSRRNLTRMAALVAGTLVAGSLTPVGPELLLAPLNVGNYTHVIQEWRPPTRNDPYFVAFLVLAAAIVLVWVRRPARVSWVQVLTLGLAIGLGLMYLRTVAVGAAVSAPLVATTLQSVLPVRREAFRPKEVVAVIGLTVTAVVLFAWAAPGRFGSDGLGPAALNDELERLPPGTVVCNEYLLGGWLLWRHPHLAPAVDGRAEVYPVEYIEDFLDFRDGAPGSSGWPEVSACSAALLPADSPAVMDMTRREWVEVERDSDYVLLQRQS